jgi:hypothetical protein
VLEFSPSPQKGEELLLEELGLILEDLLVNTPVG